MKHQHIIRIAIVLAGTLVFMWVVPALVKLGASSPQRYPFVYYSSVIEQFCFRETAGKTTVRRDASGKEYTEAQFDSIMPMLYYRQLSVNGAMPDSIQGRAVTMPEIRQHSFTYRYTPVKTASPSQGLYVMYESMPRRLTIESPGDVFRMKDGIAFVDIATNTVNEEKSALFAAELEKRGYRFPAQWSQGVISTKKPYDEGYFSLDAEGKLFHIKMVNGRPFIRDTRASDTVEVAYFDMSLVADKRFYGFLYDTSGGMYMVESPGYRLIKAELPPIDLKRDEVMIMANMFFWTVSVTTPEGRHYYALENRRLGKVDETFIAATPDGWSKSAKWLFPVYLTFENHNSEYLKPALTFTAWTAWAGNLAAAVLFVLFARRKRKNLLRQGGYILIAGIAGLIAILITPDEN
ncbi:MAG: DUF4857 domain-containing protein [Bacteroidales bacterium]|jgi:hypothetical protein|nr:DUF4857 domain-containing protein [Bacteroidales bacterium]